jgi:hypothetical protein
VNNNVTFPIRPGRTPLERDISEDAIGQMRAFANLILLQRRAVTTAATGMVTQVWLDAKEIPFNTAPKLAAIVHGRSADGTSYFSHEIVGQFFRGGPGTAAVQLGATQERHPVIRSAGALVAALGVDADSKLFVTVTDGGLATLDWECWVEEFRQ